MKSQNKFLNTIDNYGICDRSGEEFDTRMWMSPPGIVLNGILYGCNLRTKMMVKVYILNGTNWSLNDMKQHCEKFPGVPEKFSGKMKSCLEDSKIYAKICYRLEHAAYYSKLGSAIAAALFVAIVIIYIGLNCFKLLDEKKIGSNERNVQ